MTSLAIYYQSWTGSQNSHIQYPGPSCDAGCLSLARQQKYLSDD
jgi:hypothetical protein